MTHTLLVVDDEPHIRLLLRQAMEQCGYDVEEAADGQEAIRRLSETTFDLVIADILMPERDGLEVIIFLRKEHPNVKVIAVSAPGYDLFLRSAKGLGAARVFQKPFKLADITSAAEELLGGTEATTDRAPNLTSSVSREDCGN